MREHIIIYNKYIIPCKNKVNKVNVTQLYQLICKSQGKAK